jgi:nucleoside 2-deoxyribosyltransferase
MKVYLAGGMKQEWRNKIKDECITANIHFFDPTKTGLHEVNEYTFWDLLAIKNCDLVFAYFEKTNTSGIGMACEIGYAIALGKPVLLLNEQPDNHNFDFVVNSGVINIKSLEQGIKIIKSIIENRVF